MVACIGKPLVIDAPNLGLACVPREGNHGCLEDRNSLLENSEALERGTPGDAARIESDQIELRAQLRRVQERASEDREVDAGASGAAGIEEHRPDALLGIERREPHHRDADRAAAS